MTNRLNLVGISRWVEEIQRLPFGRVSGPICLIILFFLAATAVADDQQIVWKQIAFTKSYMGNLKAYNDAESRFVSDLNIWVALKKSLVTVSGKRDKQEIEAWKHCKHDWEELDRVAVYGWQDVERKWIDFAAEVEK